MSKRKRVPEESGMPEPKKEAKKVQDDPSKKAEDFVAAYADFRIQCELAGMGGLSHPSTTWNLLSLSRIYDPPKETPIVQSLDSCGAGATLVSQVALGAEQDNPLVSRTPKGSTLVEHIAGYKKDGFEEFQERKSLPALEQLPAMMRIEVERPGETENTWVFSHSYVFIATRCQGDDQKTITGRLIQCYQGNYTHADYLAEREGKAEIKLTDHFKLLADLTNPQLDVKQRAASYNQAFSLKKRQGAATRIDPLKIYVKTVAFDPDIAYQRLVTQSHFVCQQTRVLCQFAGVRIDPEQLPPAPEGLWRPRVSFLPIVLRACERFNERYHQDEAPPDEKQPALRDTALASFALDEKPLEVPRKHQLARGSRSAPHGLSKSYINQNELPSYQPPAPVAAAGGVPPADQGQGEGPAPSSIG